MIQIKADATSAIQAFKNVATGVQQVEQAATVAAPATAAVSQTIIQAGKAAQKAGGHIAGMSYYFRSFFDSMRFAMLGNPMAAFYMVDEATRAMVASGLGLMPIAGIITGIGAALGGTFLLWEEFGNHIDRDAEKAKKLATALEKIPEAVKRAYEAQQLGAITEEMRKKYEKYLSGQVPLFVAGGTKKNPDLVEGPMGNLGFNGGKFNPLAEGPNYPAFNAQAGPTMAAATPEQILAWFHGKIDQAMNANRKTVMGNEVSQADAEQASRRTPQQKELQQSLEAYNKIMGIVEKINKSIGEVSAKQFEADEKHRAELERQAQLQRDIAREDLQDQIEDVKANDLLTAQQKLVLVTALQQQQKKINDSEIAELEKLKSQVATISDQLELEKKIAQLKRDNNRIDNRPSPKEQASFSYQWGSMLASQSSKWTGWAQESANSFAKAWDGATNSVADGLTHLFEYGAQRGQWFRQLWNGVIGSMISSVTHLAVEWVAQHVIMTAAHSAMEQSATLATAAGATERGAIRTIETVLHNTLVALRVAAHAAGEAASTAITAVQAMARAIYHAIAAAIGAMESEASVPYVGPILGIAAAAAIMAAAYGMMGGFAEGGYTGDGPAAKVAGVVHAGEYVTPASRTAGSMRLLQAIHRGDLSDSAFNARGGALT